MERVQRRAARFVCGDYEWTSSVTDMLKDLSWSTLEERRESNQLIYLYKILHNIVLIKPDVLQPKSSRLRRGHTNQIHEIRANTNVYLQSFVPRAVRKWNMLPQETISAPSLNIFRSKF